MKERLEAARKRLAELEAILTQTESTGQALSPDKSAGDATPVVRPDEVTRGSIVYLRGVIKHLERMTAPRK
jgi:hypothetical protein